MLNQIKQFVKNFYLIICAIAVTEYFCVLLYLALAMIFRYGFRMNSQFFMYGFLNEKLELIFLALFVSAPLIIVPILWNSSRRTVRWISIPLGLIGIIQSTVLSIALSFQTTPNEAEKATVLKQVQIGNKTVSVKQYYFPFYVCVDEDVSIAETIHGTRTLVSRTENIAVELRDISESSLVVDFKSKTSGKTLFSERVDL